MSLISPALAAGFFTLAPSGKPGQPPKLLTGHTQISGSPEGLDFSCLKLSLPLE